MNTRHPWSRLLRVGSLGLLGMALSGAPAGSSAAVLPDPAPDAPDKQAAQAPPAPGATAAPAPVHQDRQDRPYRHVLIISEDGMRPDLITQQYMPWHERLAREGSYTYHARTIRTSDTLPSHASMLSGVDVNLHGLSWNSWRPARGFIHTPTIFSEAGDHGLKTAAFVGKFKLRHILPEGTVGFFERPGYYCKKVSEEAARYLEQEKPDLAFVHFSDPDEAGHAAGWMSQKQRRAAQNSDQCLGTIYQALQRAGTLDDTLIIVSADHGGHNHSHNSGLACDREIPWIARGPHVRQHYAIHTRISTMDTAATVLRALGLPISGRLTGQPVGEIFETL